MKREFMYAFQIDRMTIFEVKYYTCGSNSNPHFVTSAGVFNQPKTDYVCCGQCQDYTLYGKAKEFYEKWDCHHLKDLTDEEYVQLLNDIEILKENYNYYYKKRDTFAGTYTDFHFHEMVDLSKLKVKNDSNFKIGEIEFSIQLNHHKNEFEGKYEMLFWHNGYERWQNVEHTFSTKREAHKWARENIKYL